MNHHALVQSSNSESVLNSPFQPHLTSYTCSTVKLNVTTTGVGGDNCINDEAVKNIDACMPTSFITWIWLYVYYYWLARS